MDWVTGIIVGAIVLIVVGFYLWGRNKPYTFKHDEITYLRHKDNSFTNVDGSRVVDPILISALTVSYKKDKADLGDWEKMANAPSAD